MMPTSMIEFANMIRPAPLRRTHRLRRPTGPAGPFDRTERFSFGMETIVPPGRAPSAGSPGGVRAPSQPAWLACLVRLPGSESQTDGPGGDRRAYEHFVALDSGGRFDRVEHGSGGQGHRAGSAGSASAGAR